VLCLVFGVCVCVCAQVRVHDCAHPVRTTNNFEVMCVFGVSVYVFAREGMHLQYL
jgi:hypothetical protein